MPRAQGRYILRTVLLMSVYVALNVAAIMGAFDRLDRLGRALVAASVALSVALQIWAVFAQIKESDEFIRMMLIKQFLIAAGAAIAISSAWGFAESYAQAPHAPGWFVYILYNACYEITAPFIKSTRL